MFGIFCDRSSNIRLIGAVWGLSVDRSRRPPSPRQPDPGRRRYEGSPGPLGDGFIVIDGQIDEIDVLLDPARLVRLEFSAWLGRE